MQRRSGTTEDVPAQPVGDLLAAEAALAAAGRRVRRLTGDALTGRGYDPDEFDAAVLELRRARGQALAVRSAWQRWQARRDPDSAPAA
jgi:hypothetical protein